MVELLVACFLAGCSSDESSVQESQPVRPAVISLTSSVEKTRATSDEQISQINTSVKVGIFGIGNNGFITNGENAAYTVESNGNLYSKKVMGWPADESSVSIYAYAPYNEAWDYDDGNTFSVANNQTTKENYLASDLLYGIPDKNPVEPTKTAVALKFTHQLSKVNITLVKADKSLDLTHARVIINNTKLATSLNPSTGVLGAASGEEADILAVSALGSASTAYVIIVPQTLKAGTKLATIDTNPSGSDNKTYIARLGSDTKFESGKSYDFTMTLSVATEVTLTQGSTSVNDWSGDQDVATNFTESVSIGDYVLADGSLVKSDELTSEQKSKVIAVIFSTDVSAIDKAAGYEGYAMGLVRMKNRSWFAGGSYGFGVSGLDAALNDLDGRSHTSEFLGSDLYKHITDSLALAEDTRNIHICYMGDYELEIGEDATNLSDWFCPSYGQFVQMLNNLGGAKITSESITSKNSSGERSFSNWGTFYRYSDDTSASKVSDSELVDNINAYVTKVGKGNILTQGNISIPTLTENANRGGLTYFEFSLKQSNVKDADGNVTSTTNDWEMTAAQGKWSDSSNAAVGGKSVLPVLAYKLPVE